MLSPEGPLRLDDPETCADRIISVVGTDIVLGLPLGLGKANSIANALYARAEADPAIKLTIFTALTLARPTGKSTLEQRFLDPLFERLAGDYPELAYHEPLQNNRLPDNIKVHESYFAAAQRLGSSLAQQLYLSTNYTHVTRDLLDRGVNVIAQLVARRPSGDDRELSLSCNPDITLELLPELKRRQRDGQPIVIAAQINDQLPFMPGPACIDAAMFDIILDSPNAQFDLFQVPKEPVDLTDYAAAFHVASLIKDGGTLQLGIGNHSDALAHILKLRHQEPEKFGAVLAGLRPKQLQSRIGGQRPFVEGLYACSEMLVEGLLELKRAGIVKRRAASRTDTTLQMTGPFIHSAFFLGSEQLYEELRTLEADAIDDIEMTSVSFVNHLYGDEDGKRRDRKHARFINRAMMATALGAVISDSLESGQVVSGVGGQYNFVAQAHELSGARAIIMLDAVRTKNGKISSNIVWNYGHTTIPRHLRDIIVTEYGIADLRGKSDQDVIAEMLSITDSRFQGDLLAAAKRAGKMPKSFTIPDAQRGNTPSQIANSLKAARAEGLLPAFPLGTEMTSVEQTLLTAMKYLKSIRHSRPRLLSVVLAGGAGTAPNPHEQAALDRLRLGSPSRIRENVLQWCVLGALRRSGAVRSNLERNG